MEAILEFRALGGSSVTAVWEPTEVPMQQFPSFICIIGIDRKLQGESMKRRTVILSAVLVLCIALASAGCSSDKKGGRSVSTDQAKAETETEPITGDTVNSMPGDDTGVTKVTTLPDEDYLAVVPVEEQYMFLSGRCDTAFPDNSEIKKISFFKLNYDMTWKCIYGSVDLANAKATYGISDGLYPPNEYQVYDITPVVVTEYRNAFDSSLLHDEVELGKGYWKVAVEYNDGTCYAYQFDINGSKNNKPENTMINMYFKQMDIDENLGHIFSIWR